MRLLKWLIVLAAAFPATAQAQLRTIPEGAKSGAIRHVQDMIVAIDGVELRLAPGAQIRDASNRLVLPAALPAGAQVKYLLDDEGLVRQVWIVTPPETKGGG
jgi:hypothetical protein